MRKNVRKMLPAEIKPLCLIHRMSNKIAIVFANSSGNVVTFFFKKSYVLHVKNTAYKVRSRLLLWFCP